MRGHRWLVVAALCLAGCQAPAGGDPHRQQEGAGESPSVPEAEMTEPPSPPAAGPQLDPAAQVAAASANLAEWLGVPVTDIELLEIRHGTWPDSSLGCPKPDVMYLQVLTPGVLIRLAAGGVEYRYHAARGGMPFHCPGRAEPLPEGAIR